MTTAIEIVKEVQTELFSLATHDSDNGRTFSVRGWPFALIRNGAQCWDLLGPKGLEEALRTSELADAIRSQVLDLEADNAGWDFNPDEVRV